MGKVGLTLAGGNYEWIRPLREGTVEVEGADCNYLCLPVEEIFWRMLRHGEFDAAEMSLSSYIINRSRGDSGLVALPVFPHRMFRHAYIFVRNDAGIEVPGDLAGKRVGVPEYEMTAAVWIRGILQDDYGLAPGDCLWFTGGLEEAGREEKLDLHLPEDVRVVGIGPRKTLSAMLGEGELDALVTARAPSCFAPGAGPVRRLFADYRAVEAAYYRRTGILPIMHTVVLKRSLYERHPWLAGSLYKAFDQARAAAFRYLFHTGGLNCPLPWMAGLVEDVRSILGPDPFAYGVEANRRALETLVRYSCEQGLAERRMDVEELFCPESRDRFKI